MTFADRTSAYCLELEHALTAPREEVFGAWTEADQLQQWFGPAGCKTIAAEVDLRVGGTYSLTVQLPEGDTVRIFGVFREVMVPEKLVYTWSFDPSPELGIRDSVVSVAFNARAQWTDILLRHDALPSEAARDDHHTGWKGCFQSLQTHLRQG